MARGTWHNGRGGAATCPPPGGLRKPPHRATQGRSGASAERPSVPLRCPSPEPHRFNCNTSYTCTYACARPRGAPAARRDAIAAPPPAGSGNFHAAQLKGAATHLPGVQACRCDALARAPSVQWKHLIHMCTPARGRVVGCYSRPPGGLRMEDRCAAATSKGTMPMATTVGVYYRASTSLLKGH